jgi:peptidoglycan/LPS O-acetylase OafA/YrhL
MRQPGFRADINGLRGLSVLLVVAYHLQLKGAGGGFIGVDVFFVVSGYLMTRILLREEAASLRAYAGFVLARARRICPALSALVVVLLVVGAVILPPFDLETLAWQALWALAFVSNLHYLAHSGYADRTADDLWLLHTWSLSVEWQFYLLYPLLTFAAIGASRRRGRPLPQVLLPLWVVLAAVSLGWQVAQRGQPLERGFFLLGARAWELLAGGLVAVSAAGAGGGGGAVSVRRWASAAGVLTILGSALALAWWRLQPAGQDWVLMAPVLGTCLVLWADDAANPLLRLRGLQAVGRWSYSIYLWHWPLLVAWRLALGPFEHRAPGAMLVIAGSLAIGALSYRFIERPALRRSGAAGASTRVVFATLAAMMALAAGLAGAALATQGLAARDPTRASDFTAHEAAIRPLLFPDERCNNFRKPVEAMVICPVERYSARRLLVIGDSHAEHLWPWFVKHSQASVDFFGASECPPAPHFERMQPGYDCRRYAARAWEMAQSPRYDTVIVSARWATVALYGPPYCHQSSPERCDELAPDRKPALVADELRAVIERTLRAGKTVVLLDGAPEARLRVAKRIARELFWYGQPRLSIDRQSLQADTGWLEPMLDGLRGQPGFWRVSLRDKLCDAHRCRVYDDTLGRSIYTDESHFDPFWIAENAGFFEPFAAREGPATALRP